MTAYPANIPLVVTRRVTVSPARVVTVQATTLGFYGRVFAPRSEEPDGTEAAPREALPGRVLWFAPGQAVGTLNAGDRIADGDISYELLTGTRGKRAGLRVLVNECVCLPVAALYPLVGSLTNQAGTVLQAALPYALWGSSESHADTGSYERLDGECPPEFASVVKANAQIRAGGLTYRIVDSSLELTVPRVTFTATRTERA